MQRPAYCFANQKRVYAFNDKTELVDYLVEQGNTIAISIAAEGINNTDPEFISITNDNIGYADGVAAVMALKKAAFSNISKIPGCELWLDVIERAGSNGVYLLGGSPDVTSAVVEKLPKSSPSVHITGSCDGFFSKKSKSQVIKEIVDEKPGIVVIAMGQPLQEKLAAELIQHHSALYLCVGGSFDVYTGKVKRAPAWMVTLKLEWLYRLYKNPSRWQRQLVLPKVAFNLLFRKNYVKLK